MPNPEFQVVPYGDNLTQKYEHSPCGASQWHPLLGCQPDPAQDVIDEGR
jgi:hypothetical protein